MPELMTPKEVAEAFRVDTKTVTRWAGAGRIPEVADGTDGVIYTPGGHCRIKTEAVEHMQAGKRPGWTGRVIPPGSAHPA